MISIFKDTSHFHMPTQIYKCGVANTPAEKNHKTVSGNVGKSRVFEERVRYDFAFSVTVL